MRKKLLTTLALLLMAVSGAWAEDCLYLDISSDGTSATLMYGDNGAYEGKPYYQSDGVWATNVYGDWDNFKENTCTTISVHESCKGFGGDRLSDLFKNFTALTTINNLDNFNTTQVKYMDVMFSGCSSLTTLDLSSWNTSKVESMSNMFKECSSLTTLNLSNWDTSNVENMGDVFCDCSSLTTLDLSSWNTSKVKSMSTMFKGCSSLTTLTFDPNKWDTSIVEDMYMMFADCQKLTTLNLSKWKTANVTNMYAMFLECQKLATLTLDPNKWDTSNVTSMAMMFLGCSSLATLNLSSWNTSKVENMNYMLAYCNELTTLDLTGWDTSKVGNMSHMFEGSEKLATIYVGDGWSTAIVTNSEDMFKNCTSLPNFDSEKIDKKYANTGANGYLNKVKVTANSDGTNYWATYYNSAHSFKADDNTTVYQAKVNGDKDAVVLTEVTSKEIPADNGVVLKSSVSSIILSVATTTATYSANDLKGTDVDLANPGNVYCLSNETTGSSPRGVGFYSYGIYDGTVQNGVIPAHRAYLVVTGGPTNSRGFLGFGDDDDATAIDNGQWKIDNSDGSIYDLSGRIVTGHPRKGIYVKNGKLVVIK